MTRTIRWRRPEGLHTMALVYEANTDTYELSVVGPEQDVNEALTRLFLELFTVLPTEGDSGDHE